MLEWFRRALNTGRGRLFLAGSWLLVLPFLALFSGIVLHKWAPPFPESGVPVPEVKTWLSLPIGDFDLWEGKIPSYRLDPELREPPCLSAEAILKRSMSLEPVTITNTCELTEGVWLDAWSGRRMTDPDKVQIVETVPVRWLLAAAEEAKRREGLQMTAAERQQWLVITPRNTGRLMVVTKRVRTRRGHLPIEHFSPWRSEPACHYALGWARVKVHYRLPVRQEERERVANYLRDCR